MADVDRPRRGQGNSLEHPSPVPASVQLLPEQRMRKALALYPGPVLSAPPSRITIAARFDELHEAGVRHIVTLDRKCRNIHRECGTLVVPRERDRRAIDAERCAAGWNFDPIL